jgi:hypothetical protein
MAELEVIFIPTCLLCSKHLFGFVPHKLEYYTLHFFATFCYIMFMLKVCPYLLFKFLFSSFCELHTACVFYVHFTPSVNFRRCSFGISSLTCNYVDHEEVVVVCATLLLSESSTAVTNSANTQSLPRSYYTYAFLFSLLTVCMYSGVWGRRLREDSVHSEVPL